jgi:hypothetical protein
MGMYDIGGASAGQASQLQPEERQFQRLQRVIKTAEASNYDGDTDYYNQIKALAMQAGIPIKQFKSNPFRAMGILGASFADTSAGGLLPNSLYTPEGGHVSTMDSLADTAGMIAGMANPIGIPAKLFGVAKGAMMGGTALSKLGKPTRSILNKMMGQSRYKKLAKGTGGFSGKGGSFMATPKKTAEETIKKAKKVTKEKVAKVNKNKPVVKTKSKNKNKNKSNKPKTGAARTAEVKQLVDKIKKLAPSKNREMLENTPVSALKAILKSLQKKS